MTQSERSGPYGREWDECTARLQGFERDGQAAGLGLAAQVLRDGAQILQLQHGLAVRPLLLEQRLAGRPLRRERIAVCRRRLEPARSGGAPPRRCRAVLAEVQPPRLPDDAERRRPPSAGDCMTGMPPWECCWKCGQHVKPQWELRPKPLLGRLSLHNIFLRKNTSS